VARTRAAVATVVAAALAAAIVSGGSRSDPRTPAAAPGLPPPFLTVAALGDGGLTAGVDAYGDVVDLRPAPAGLPLIDNPLARQQAGTVSAATGIVPRVSVAGGPPQPLWRADAVHQRFLPGTGVLRTIARFGAAVVWIECAAAGEALGCVGDAATDGHGAERTRVTFARHLEGDERTVQLGDRAAGRLLRGAAAADRRWIARARPLAPAAPAWARRLYRRSLLVLRSLTDDRTGAVAAGARDGWAYVWPRDAGAVAIALGAAGYRAQARRVARFLRGLPLAAAARFDAAGDPVPGRAAQGDAWGWAVAAARATGAPPPPGRPDWRGRADYQEKAPGEYLANAIASATPLVDGPIIGAYRQESAHQPRFLTRRGLVREAGDPESGLDSAAAWAVRPFPHPALFPAVRMTLRRIAAAAGRFGIVPSQDWPGAAPWTAPTAWCAWSLAALSESDPAPAARRDRAAALRLLADLRRAATPAGALPERVGGGGLPLSTAPLAWSHAFAILAIRRLWPEGRGGRQPGRRQRESQ
jgi:glucoamylase